MGNRVCYHKDIFTPVWKLSQLRLQKFSSCSQIEYFGKAQIKTSENIIWKIVFFFPLVFDRKHNKENELFGCAQFPLSKEVFFYVSFYITKTRLFKYTENFISKNWKFSDKRNSDIFHISAQNIDCGYSTRRF